MNLITRFLQLILTLPFVEGYRTYAGAVGIALTGLGSFGAGIAFFLASPPDTEKGIAAFVAGAALISQALAVFGQRSATAAATAKIEAAARAAQSAARQAETAARAGDRSLS